MPASPVSAAIRADVRVTACDDRSSAAGALSWLVLASEFDASARWVADGLEAESGSVLFVTDGDLAGATWNHCVGDESVFTRVELADGRTIDTDLVRGTFNRLTWVPPALVEPLVVDDRQYGMQEFSALVMSWLASFRGPIINPPDTRGLSGAWRAPTEWAMLARSAGLDAAPVFFDSEADAGAGAGADVGNGWYAVAPCEPFAADVIVVGDAVFSDADLSPAIADACRRLADSAATPVLGLAFAGDGTGALAGVTPMPDLRAGGDAAIDAVADALGGRCPP